MLQHLHTEYLYITVILVLSFLLLRLSIKKIQEKRDIRKRFKRGGKMEKRGRDFLIKHGFKIEHEQYIAHHVFYVDNKRISIGIKPDYIVIKDGKRYIVDVKSGHSAISLKDKATRRQMLEYDHTIPNDGIFLLDMENEQLKHIEFHSWRDGKTNGTESAKYKHKKLILPLVIIIISLLIFICFLR